MPRTEEVNQRIRDERRQEILSAAEKVFARKGLAATKIGDIASAADMSYGLIYHYFPSKEDVFSALQDIAKRNVTQLATFAQQRPGTSWDKLYWMVSLILRSVSENPASFMAFLQALTTEAVSDETRDTAWETYNISWRTIADLLAQGQAAGDVIAGNTDYFASILAACINGLALQATFLDHDSLALPDPDTLLNLFKA